MRRATATAGVLLLALGMLACRRSPLLLESRHASIGGSALVTQFRKVPRADANIALAHVLFVPERDVPTDGGFGNGTSSGGTADIHELAFQYYETESEFSMQSRPVTILKADTVEAGGRTFQLVRGNLFVATCSLRGFIRMARWTSTNCLMFCKTLPHL